jgi:hypothetical protein
MVDSPVILRYASKLEHADTLHKGARGDPKRNPMAISRERISSAYLKLSLEKR